MTKRLSTLDQGMINDLATISLAGSIRRDKIQTAHQLATPFVVTTVLTMTIIGTIGTAMIFPGLPIWSLILLTIAGLVVDTLFYTDDTLKSFRMIFGIGLFQDLENHVINRELNKKLAKQQEVAEKNLLQKYKNCDLKLLKLLKNKDKNQEKIVAYLKTNPIPQATLDSLVKELNKIKKQRKGSQGLIDNIAEAWRMKKNTKGSLTPQEKQDLLQTYKNSHSLLNRAGYKIERILQKQRTELITKKILIVLGVVIALINGFGWAAMAYIHLVPLLTLMSMPLTALPILAGGIAVFAGVSWFMMMYKMISGAIKKNIFRVLWDKLDMTRKKDENGELPPLGWHILKWALKLIPVVLIISIGIITTFLSAGALLDASVQVITLILTHPEKIAMMACQILMYGIVLPFTMLFSVKHSLSAFHKLVDIAKTTWKTLGNPRDIFQDIKDRPIRSLFYIGGFIIAGLALGIHLVAEAASTAGEGAAVLTGWAGKLFKWIASLIRIKPVSLAVTSGAVIEGLEHGDFVLDYTKKRVDCIFDSINPPAQVHKSKPVSQQAIYNFFQEALPIKDPGVISTNVVIPSNAWDLLQGKPNRNS